MRIIDLIQVSYATCKLTPICFYGQMVEMPELCHYYGVLMPGFHNILGKHKTVYP